MAILRINRMLFLFEIGCEFMGSILDQCANDAWDVIRGRKKIVGNVIIDINKEETEYTEKQRQNMDGCRLMEDFIMWNLEIIKNGLLNIYYVYTEKIK